jgi:hypothetical protein
MDERFENVGVVLARALHGDIRSTSRSAARGADEVRKGIAGRLGIAWRVCHYGCRGGLSNRRGTAVLELANAGLEIGDATAQTDILALKLAFTQETDLVCREGGAMGGAWRIDKATTDDGW